MSGNNNTASTVADRHLHAVDTGQTVQNLSTTADKVRTALAAAPGSTTADLARAAGVGRSTAAKILAQWGHDGTAIRTPGDGPRKPDTWAPAPSEHDTAAPGIANTLSDAPTTPGTDQPTTDAHHTADDTTAGETEGTEETTADVDDAPTEDTTAVGPQTATETDDDKAATASTDDAPAPPTDGESDRATPPPVTAPTDPVTSTAEAAPSSAAPPAVVEPADTTPTDKNRLRKGGLRALVEEYLTEHPDESFGPAKIGRDLNRSGGAVNNALEKLVADGYAIKTCEAPKRFAINPDKTDVPEKTDGTE